MPILNLVDFLHKLLFSNYVDVINLREKRGSDYKKYKTHKPKFIMSDRDLVEKESSLPFCKEYSYSMKTLDNLLGN